MQGMHGEPVRCRGAAACRCWGLFWEHSSAVEVYLWEAGDVQVFSPGSGVACGGCAAARVFSSKEW